MTRRPIRANIIILVLLSFSAIAADAPPAFEVADIRASARLTNPYMRGGLLRGGRYDVRTANMVELVSAAYGVEGDKVLGGPSWLEIAPFDIAAKTPANTPPKTVGLMLRTLLADRFQLKVHTESKPMPAYVLSADKSKPKLKEADGSANNGRWPQPVDRQPGLVVPITIVCRNRTMEQLAQGIREIAGGYLDSAVIDQTGIKGDPRIANPILTRLMTCQNMTMAQFADLLPNWVGGYVHLNVLDSTGLTDAYDFTVSFSPVNLVRNRRPAQPSTPTGDEAVAADPNGAVSLPDALNRQLGLKLELTKHPMQVLVIDHLDENPTAN